MPPKSRSRATRPAASTTDAGSFDPGSQPIPRVVAPAIAGPNIALTRGQSMAAGRQALANAPLESLGELADASDRDPIGLLLEQDASRVPELVPVRHGRMMVSPFTFYRGAALPMAADLAIAPSSGLWAQLCGDAHLSNFGAFASPERRLVFDINDFDETLPGPFEWDVKRLIASMAVAGRSNGLSRKKRRTIALHTVASYRKSMQAFAELPMLDVWYARADVEQALKEFRSRMTKKSVKQTKAQIAKAVPRTPPRRWASSPRSSWANAASSVTHR